MSWRDGSCRCRERRECSRGLAMILRMVECISEASLEIDIGFIKVVRI